MAKTMVELTTPVIGYFQGAIKTKSAIPRQASVSKATGHIQFNQGFDHTLALSGLERMSHVWLIFQFHEAKSKAKPLVRPPRASDQLIGLYATRSPYRPSRIGLSLVQIDQIKNKKLFLKNVDLLDGTPIFDIKPYHPESDVALNPSLGWIADIQDWRFDLSEIVKKKLAWLQKHQVLGLEDFLFAALSSEPQQKSRKRIQAETGKTTHLMAFRTWRFRIQIFKETRSSTVLDLMSGYSLLELKNPADPYADKKIHQLFLKTNFFD